MAVLVVFCSWVLYTSPGGDWWINYKLVRAGGGRYINTGDGGGDGA